MTRLLGFFLGLGGKLKAGLVIAAGVAVALFLAWRRAREDGKNELLRQQQETRDALQQHYDEIDSRPVDPHASIERMRSVGRSQRKD